MVLGATDEATHMEVELQRNLPVPVARARLAERESDAKAQCQ